MDAMAKAQTSVPLIIEDCHRLIVWLVPLLDHFPCARRYTLGQRLEDGLLEVLGLLVDAAYRRDRLAVLRAANRRLAVVRHVWRICLELKVIPPGRYEHGARLIDALGRQAGGWLRHSEGRMPTVARASE